MSIPRLGPCVPRRRSALLRWLGRTLWRGWGWSFEGEYPDTPRCVLAVAPHTSNWDYVVGILAVFALGLDARYVGKHTLFRGPLGWFMRVTGGIPLDRGAPGGLIAQVVLEFRRLPALHLGIAPEGTRRSVERWKSGFYRIAREADARIVPVAFDWSRRCVVLLPPFEPGGDWDADEPRLRALFRREMALRPEGFWVDQGEGAAGSRPPGGVGRHIGPEAR